MKPTTEQRAAIRSRRSHLYVEAEPGSGKTAVAAARFGVQRYRDTSDNRSVLAVSFTRSATDELRIRIRALWGPGAVSWIHEVTTIDSLIHRIVRRLLHHGHISWPGGHQSVVVADSWKGELPHDWRDYEPLCTLKDRQVVVTSRYKRARHPSAARVRECVAEGRCTHSDLRSIVTASLNEPNLRAEIVDFFAESTRALIVDEVFDGNELDLALVECAAEAGSDVSLVGDPWQALYEFRGATPKEVPEFIAKHPFETLPLTASRRWKTDTQRELAIALRHGDGIELGTSQGRVDVVIGRFWASLWAAGPPVLPLAFGSLSNDDRDAALCLLLNAATELHLGVPAAGLMDARFSLRITVDQRTNLQEPLEAMVHGLDPTNPEQTYTQLSGLLSGQAIATLGPARDSDHRDIEALANAVRSGEPAIAGLTSHQAKGREWDRVGVVLTAKDVDALESGLSVDVAADRALYVACTRARYSTTVWAEVA